MLQVTVSAAVLLAVAMYIAATAFPRLSLVTSREKALPCESVGELSVSPSNVLYATSNTSPAVTLLLNSTATELPFALEPLLCSSGTEPNQGGLDIDHCTGRLGGGRDTGGGYRYRGVR